MIDVPSDSRTEAVAGDGGLPGGTVAFLFTDLEGSTQHLRRLGDSYQALIEAHDRLLRDSFAAHRGQVVDTQGDSFFVVFTSVRDAAAAAADAQRALAGHAWPEHADVRVRMGLHAGEPLVSERRYVGLDVHRAARICAAAHGGQVLLSQAAASLLVENEPHEVTVLMLGPYVLKDFDRPEPLSQLVIAGLDSDFPPLTGGPHGAARAGVEFRILGPLEVIRDGSPVAIGGQRQRALLGLLLLRPNEEVSTERLVDELWGERPPRTATTSLQNAVVQLRKLLGPGVLETHRRRYVLRLAPEQLDLAAFESLVGRSREAEPAERLELLRTALGLWRGAPLADFAEDEFAQSEIRRLDELRLAAIEHRIDAELELGGHEGLVAEVEQLVSRHPLREGLRGQLMLALYGSGRQADALEAYHDARRTLRDELGIEPGPALQQIHARILRQDSSLVPAGRATTAHDHYSDVLKAFLSSRLVPVLGPGALLSGRPADAVWETPLAPFPPAHSELASHLAREFEYPPQEGAGLSRVSEYVSVTKGIGPLHDALHAVFDRDYPPGPVQLLVAAMQPVLRSRGMPCQLIVTTGFDDAVEQAFARAGEPLDVVSYVAAGRDRGRFLHTSSAGETRLIVQPNVETAITPDRNAVLLRIHGGVDRGERRDHESFVVSEDDHIDYLAQVELSAVLPVTLAASLRRSHFLFLGYGVDDWSLRVFLRRLWGEERMSYRSWAVQPHAGVLDAEYWRQQGVDVFEVGLEEYTAELWRLVDEEVGE